MENVKKSYSELAIEKAAKLLAVELPHFYGKIQLTFEDGRFVFYKVEKTGKPD